MRFLGVALASRSLGLILGAPGHSLPQAGAACAGDAAVESPGQGVPQNPPPSPGCQAGTPRAPQAPGCSGGCGGLSPPWGRRRGEKVGGDEGRCDSRGSSSTGALTGPPRSPQTLWPWAELPLSPPSVAAELEDPGGSAPIPAPGAPGAGTLPRTGTSTLREPWAVALLLSRLVPPSQSTAPRTVRGCHGPVAPGRAAMRGQFPARRRGWAEPGWGSHVWPLDALAGGIVAPGTRLHAQGDMLAPSGDSPTPSCSPPFQVTAPHPPRVTFPASSTRPAFPSPAQRHLLQPPGQPGDISCAAPPPQVTSPAPPPWVTCPLRGRIPGAPGWAGRCPRVPGTHSPSCPPAPASRRARSARSPSRAVPGAPPRALHRSRRRF